MSAEQPLPVADLMGNFGPLPEVHFNGKTYPVGLPCPEVIATAERMVPALALENVRAVFDGADLAAEEAAVKTAIRGRQYGFGQPLYLSVIGGPDGNKLILWACLKLKTPGVTLATVRDMLRDDDAAAGLEAALEVVAPAFFRVAAEESELPRRERERLAGELVMRATADLLERKLRRLRAEAGQAEATVSS
jgi:hypothetical protein